MNPGQLSYQDLAETKAYLPNPIMVSRQIDGLREVMRRMRTTQSSTIEIFINQKLEKLTEN